MSNIKVKIRDTIIGTQARWEGTYMTVRSVRPVYVYDGDEVIAVGSVEQSRDFGPHPSNRATLFFTDEQRANPVIYVDHVGGFAGLRVAIRDAIAPKKEGVEK